MSGLALSLDADVLVLGGGPAGAWAAMAAAERGASVVLADKGRMGSSGATAAVNTALIDVAPDSAEEAFVLRRRLERGEGLVSADAVLRMTREAHRRLSALEGYGYVFACDDAGRRYRGALRGPDYMQILRRRLLKLGVRLLDHHPALQLLLSDGVVAGARGIDRRSGAEWRVRAGGVVVATGGAAFRSKALGTYSLTGDGLLMAAEAGARLTGLEFSGQYGVCPAGTTVTKNLIYDWATFSDEDGRTLSGEDVFDTVARALPRGAVYAIIDRADGFIEQGLRRGQPNIFLALDRQGVDPFRQRFPVTLRYEGTVRGVGGLTVAADGATTAPGLFAAGDAAARIAVAGANSGGGGPNATWAIASGALAGAAAAGFARELGPRVRLRGLDAVPPPAGASASAEAAAHWAEAVQALTFPLERSYARDGATLLDSLARLDALWREAGAAGGGETRLAGREAAAMIATARWIAASALARPETRGIHRRTDFPAADPRWTGAVEIAGLNVLDLGEAKAAA
jgi:succinate dehydrogenase/fumarate reductase flavoprotein subunit